MCRHWNLESIRALIEEHSISSFLQLKKLYPGAYSYLYRTGQTKSINFTGQPKRKRGRPRGSSKINQVTGFPPCPYPEIPFVYDNMRMDILVQYMWRESIRKNTDIEKVAGSLNLKTAFHKYLEHIRQQTKDEKD